MSSKLLPCKFNPEVLCSFRRSEKVYVMDRCMKCKHYLEFAQDQEDFENEVFEEAERLWRDESHG
jgi:hypothetical protein